LGHGSPRARRRLFRVATVSRWSGPSTRAESARVRSNRPIASSTWRGGGCGIRTREGLPPTRFPSVRPRPLGESSVGQGTGAWQLGRPLRHRPTTQTGSLRYCSRAPPCGGAARVLRREKETMSLGSRCRSRVIKIWYACRRNDRDWVGKPIAGTVAGDPLAVSSHPNPPGPEGSKGK
jgi:hypothetical protein